MEKQRELNVIELAIRHAVVAGGLRKAAREYPDAAVGLLKAARFHSAKTAILAWEIAGTTALG